MIKKSMPHGLTPDDPTIGPTGTSLIPEEPLSSIDPALKRVEKLFVMSPRSCMSSNSPQNRGKEKWINDKAKSMKAGLSKLQPKQSSVSQYKIARTPHNDPEFALKSARSNKSFMEHKNEYSVLDGSVMHTSRLDISIDECGRKHVNQYAVQRTLGQGSFGKVKLFRCTITNQLYAAKIIDQKKVKVKYITMGLLNLANAESFQKEIAILKNLDHPNIVKLHEVIEDETRDEVYLVMDWVKKGAVMSKDYWKSELGLRRMKSSDIPSCLSVEKARKYFQGLVSGIHYCNLF
jgi:hypothetical protein